jgi:hypothetical protein
MITDFAKPLPDILSAALGAEPATLRRDIRSFEIRITCAGPRCQLISQTKQGTAELLNLVMLDAYASEIASTFRHSRFASMRLALRGPFKSSFGDRFATVTHASVFTDFDDYIHRCLVKGFPWEEPSGKTDAASYSFDIWLRRGGVQAELQAWMVGDDRSVIVPIVAERIKNVWERVKAWSGGAKAITLNGSFTRPSKHQRAAILHHESRLDR